MMVRIKARREEVRPNVFEEWRVIKDHPDYEITKDGVIRKYSTKKVIKSTSYGITQFRYTVGRYHKFVSTAKLRNVAFPELEAW